MEFNITPSTGSEVKTIRILSWAFSITGVIVLLIGISVSVIFITILGALVLAIGLTPWLLKKRRYNQITELKQKGILVKARSKGVTVNHLLQVNDSFPYQIVCEWVDKDKNEIHIFHSENLWYDPTPYLNREEIDVLVLPDNYKKYYVDISFLPKRVQ